MKDKEKEHIELFASLMIDKIKNLEDSNFTKPWFSYMTEAQNISERSYNGINSILLLMQSEKQGYKCPVYMTFAQAKEMNLSINKGAKSFPVIYWNFIVTDDKGKRISKEEYETLILQGEGKEKYKVQPYRKFYNVFNVEQTNFPQIHERRWKAMVDKFTKLPELTKDIKYDNKILDILISKQEWICPILLNKGNKACYKILSDTIEIPHKELFKNDVSFYSVLLHEMTHSTSKPLERNILNSFGDPDYAKEEIIAELSSALVGLHLGLSTSPREENAQYLKSWINVLREKPEYIYNVLSDVSKASSIIIDRKNLIEQKYGITNSISHPIIEDNIKREYYASGKIYKEIPFYGNEINGEMKMYYENGQVRISADYINGKLYGAMREYTPEGILKDEFLYKNDKRDGVCRTYFPNGAINIESNYLRNKLHGVETIYHPKADGSIFFQQHYHHGMLHGSSIEYDEKGKIKREEYYYRDKKVSKAEFKKLENRKITKRGKKNKL